VDNSSLRNNCLTGRTEAGGPGPSRACLITVAGGNTHHREDRIRHPHKISTRALAISIHLQINLSITLEAGNSQILEDLDSYSPTRLQITPMK